MKNWKRKMTRIESTWAECRKHAEANPLEPGGMKLLHLDPEGQVDLYAGIDEESRVLLALRLSHRPPQVKLESDALEQFRLQRADGSWLMVLRLDKEGLEPVFGRLCQDLVDAAEGMQSEPRLLELFMTRLKLWESLFALTDHGLLSTSQVRGLLAELTVLEQLLKKGKRAPSDLVAGWVGPAGADQDFFYSDVAFEVKSLAPGRSTVAISSLGQLDSAVPLQLVLIELATSSAADQDGISLNDIVARLEMLLSADGAALNLFRSRLLEAGYVEHPGYDEKRFVPTLHACFSVSPGFPRLVREKVPAGIADATYQLELAALQPFRTTAIFA